MGVGVNTTPPSCGRTWFPCYDRPCDKATVDLTATVPLDKTVVANGLLASVDSSGANHTWHWSHDFPTSTYLIAMSVAPYRVLSDSVVTDPRIKVYFHTGYRLKATVSFQYVDLMMEAFEAKFGTYPFDKFAYMTTLRGDMEHQTCVSHLLALVDSTNNNDDILSHEMCHMWYGDCVTYGDWRDVWLSEGFATYGEAVYREYKDGPAAYHNYVTTQFLNRVIASGASGNDGVYDPSYLWGVVAYEKGASVLHMLRGVLDNDTLFFQALRDYRNAHLYGNAVTPDFIADVETTVGQDLSWFFDPWVYGDGHPVYQYGWSWDALGGGQWKVDVVIRQTQTTPTLFDMPLDFRVQTGSRQLRLLAAHQPGRADRVVRGAGAAHGARHRPERLGPRRAAPRAHASVDYGPQAASRGGPGARDAAPEPVQGPCGDPLLPAAGRARRRRRARCRRSTGAIALRRGGGGGHAVDLVGPPRRCGQPCRRRCVLGATGSAGRAAGAESRGGGLECRS